MVGGGDFNVSSSKWCCQCTILTGLSSGNSGDTEGVVCATPFVDEALH